MRRSLFAAVTPGLVVLLVVTGCTAGSTSGAPAPTGTTTPLVHGVPVDAVDCVHPDPGAVNRAGDPNAAGQPVADVVELDVCGAAGRARPALRLVEADGAAFTDALRVLARPDVAPTGVCSLMLVWRPPVYAVTSGGHVFLVRLPMTGCTRAWPFGDLESLQPSPSVG